MKGHVPTPNHLAGRIVDRLFRDQPPKKGDRILYPGSGDAPFAAVVERLCMEKGWPVPEGHGVEVNPKHVRKAKSRGLSHTRFYEADFLDLGKDDLGTFDFVVGNPPYVAVDGLSEAEKERYRAKFLSASGRMDLYFLFFEQSLNLLRENGRLAFITPEKWTYVESASPLRGMLGSYHIEAIEHVAEDAFGGLVTYPAITVIRKAPAANTDVTLRNGETYTTKLPATGESWAAPLRGPDQPELDTSGVLADAVVRISAGVATGRDRLFVMEKDRVPENLTPKWVHPTVSGRDLGSINLSAPPKRFICPYTENGQLHPENELGAYREWATQHRDELETRFCVSQGGKPWYSWHETPPMTDLLRPKILFKDVASEPRFWMDTTGEIIPRHSVYYAVPKQGVDIKELTDYLNSKTARNWMERHCQRAANGFIRLQSRVLKKLPIPDTLHVEGQIALAL